jgi:hypothetical protein
VSLDAQGKVPAGIWLLKKRVRGLERGGQIDDSPGAADDSLERRVGGRGRRGPHEEDRVDTFQARVERLGNRQISVYALNSVRQAGEVRFAEQGPHGNLAVCELRGHMGSHIAGRTDQQDSFH